VLELCANSRARATMHVSPMHVAEFLASCRFRAQIHPENAFTFLTRAANALGIQRALSPDTRGRDVYARARPPYIFHEIRDFAYFRGLTSASAHVRSIRTTIVRGGLKDKSLSVRVAYVRGSRARASLSRRSRLSIIAGIASRDTNAFAEFSASIAVL